MEELASEGQGGKQGVRSVTPPPPPPNPTGRLRGSGGREQSMVPSGCRGE